MPLCGNLYQGNTLRALAGDVPLRLDGELLGREACDLILVKTESSILPAPCSPRLASLSAQPFNRSTSGIHFIRVIRGSTSSSEAQILPSSQRMRIMMR